MGKQAVNKMRTQFLLKDVSDTATVNAGIKIVTEKLASIGIDFTFELSAFSGELKSYTSSYVDTAGQRMSFTCVHPSSFPSYQTYGTDNVCLIYDWTKVSPQPSNPVNHGKHIQLPIQFFVTFPEVFAQFFFHELCHDLVPDLTHNQGLNTEWSQKPPTDYYLYLLKTYYKGSLITNPKPIDNSLVTKPTLKEGMKSLDVLTLQTYLRVLGYFNQNPTSYFGSITKQSVKDFQKANGLVVDGIFGKASWTVILDLIAKKKVLVEKTGIYQLYPLVERARIALIEACRLQGEDIKVTEGYRSIERQNALYAQGRTVKGKIVTKAKGGQSLHNYGVAFDVIYKYKGKWTFEVPDALPIKIGKIGKAMGLKWGGKSDMPHFQITFGYEWQDFKNNKINWDKFK